ncbi:hypothetical protein CAPTEDRAFT_23022, partial [Capitella teleta]
MAVFGEADKQRFPLRSVQEVVDLFNHHLANSDEPNLALLSVILGCIEHDLTVNRGLATAEDGESAEPPSFPVLQLSTVDALYQRFVAHIKGNVDLSGFESDTYATREIIKKVSDVIWNSLSRSYHKDRAHLQSLYSFLTGSKLDCFGLAFAVVAGCQVLGLSDVHLALAEDHAWVVFGPDGTDTVEVTWHGKGNEDKRGQSASLGISQMSWLYLNGCPVVCTRAMETAAIVSALNPAINASMDSLEMGRLQQGLLWLLYDLGHLDKYPMALGNLGDLEEICPTPCRPSCVALFHKAVESSRQYYSNMHVYPYIYLGGYYYRKGYFRQAICSWAQAATVITKFNYSREDEEIYKEFFEVANEVIPHIIKVCSDYGVGAENGVDAGLPLLQDPEVYALLLQFYDGICQWEEGSQTPVVHITWAKHLCFSLSKFECAAREHLRVEADSDSEKKRKRREQAVLLNNNYEQELRTTIEELASRVGPDTDTPDDPNIAALAHACGESILNPEFLLSGGEPFKTQTSSTSSLPSSPAADLLLFRSRFTRRPDGRMAIIGADGVDCEGPRLQLRSMKMKGMRRLLVSEKLNSSAIKLQFTAQSQVHL